MVVRYSHDGPHLLGTGGALRRALPLLDDVFWVLYGDSYLDLDYQEVLDQFRSTDSLGLMTVVQNNNRWDRSNVHFRDGRLVCYSKRLVHPEMAHIDYGLSLLRRPALDRIPASQPSDLAQLYSELVSEGTMIGHEVGQRFYEIGSPAGRAETECHLLARGSCRSGAA
jgi:NDP-sugar pyrophosphorylase family protein